MDKKKILRFGKVLLYVVGVGVVLFFMTTIPTIQDWVTKPLFISEQPMKSNVIIVLGGGVEKNGAIGPIVADRIHEGVLLANEGWAHTILLSGGVAHLKKEYVESVQMKEYLRAHEQTNASIVLEEHSTSTRQNAEFTKTVMEQRGWKHALVVTSAFHSKRACDVFHTLHMSVICVAATKSYRFRTYWDQVLLTKGIFREYGATIYYKVLGYI